ncbi:unnamed protein product [Malus baccata var. baccata]
MDGPQLSASLLTLLALSFFSEVNSASFKLLNKCRYQVWPGILSGANSAPLSPTGFALKPGKSRTLSVPISWSGRIWARTLCTEYSPGNFSCVTADCGSGKIECAGGGAKPPATLAEFTLNGADGLDFYDVSLVDVQPADAGGAAWRNKRGCPRALRVREGGWGSVACRSACEAFGDPQFCCSEGYATPDTCQPSAYSLFFKHACPRSYSYAYDDKTSTYTCASAHYVIIFCPLPYTSLKVLGARKDGAALPLVNKTMMYF